MGRMYPERAGNVSVFRGCAYSCAYCAFRTSLSRSGCKKCRDFEPHAHLEALEKNPPKTGEGEFLTIGLTGDISFMYVADFWKVMEYCRKWKDRTFLIQSKDPGYFLRYQEFVMPFRIPDNAIIGTTIETNRGGWICDPVTTNPTALYCKYDIISKAPLPEKRYEAMRRLDCRKAITIEPILDFDLDIMLQWTKDIAPEFIYIGYNSKKDIKLPEPSLSKTTALIAELRGAGFDVREKLLRKAWWEE